MERQAEVRREGGDSPSRAVHYVIYLDGNRHSAHRTTHKALVVLSDIGVPKITRVARGRLIYVATLRPRLTSTGRLSPSWRLAAEQAEPQSRLYVHRHVLAQPAWNEHRYGQQVPTPSYDRLMEHATKVTMPGSNPFRHTQTFQHQFTHQGRTVAKLEYGIRPLGDVDVMHVHGLAVHPEHRRDGLASALMDHMQDNAAEHGRKIDHGSRTPAGYRWWQRYSASETHRPEVHLPSEGDHGPSPDLRSEDTYDALFDPHEHDQAKTGSASPSWVHYYANVPEGWEV